jgi:DNA-directed RNA polymerase specialized sigma24 family protein
VVTAAVTERQVPLRQAQAVYLTRVAGWSTTEAGRLLGCDPAVVRVLRARAAARLAA